MSEYKLEFKLKQHTPLIHFQHEQHGATLRASELKPKLDRFLIEQFGGILNFDAYKKFLIGDVKSIDKALVSIENDNSINDKDKAKIEYLKKQHLALDYKVRISSLDIKSIKIEKGKNHKAPNYFANMGDDYTPKALSISLQDIDFKITVFSDDLKENLKSNINEFFLTHNFGTRQSKGFGSFTLKNLDLKKDVFDVYFQINKLNCNDYLLKNRNDLYKDIWKNYLKIFWYIETFYKNLRSGINRKGGGGITNFYLKPAIFYYSWYRLNKQWDKKSIKQYYLSRELANQNIEHKYPDILSCSDTDNPHILIKDMFGLSSLENWMKYKNSVSKSHDSIDRFKSPVLFKPIIINNQFFIGIKCFEIDSDFLDEVFSIDFGRNNGLELKTPKSFDWSDFWDYYFNNLPKLDDRCNSDNDVNDQAEYCILSKINENIIRTGQ